MYIHIYSLISGYNVGAIIKDNRTLQQMLLIIRDICYFRGKTGAGITNMGGLSPPFKYHSSLPSG